MPHYVHGLLIAGLSYNGATSATLFTDGDLKASTLPSLPPVGTTVQVVNRLKEGGWSGSGARTNLRDPMITATTPSAYLQDDADGSIAALFSPDPGWRNTDRWMLRHEVLIEDSDTTMILTGPVAPTINQLIWVGPECVKVTSVSTHIHEHTCGVTRAQCGSRAIEHCLDPSSYPNTTGAKEAIRVYSRQVFDGTRKIEAACYRFKMSATDPASVSSVEWAWVGYLAERPKQNDNLDWVVSVQHLSKKLDDHTIRGGEEITSEHVVEIVSTAAESLSPQFGVGPNLMGFAVPQAVRIRLSVYNAERLLNAPMHAPGFANVGTSLDLYFDVTSRLTGGFSDPRAYLEIAAKVGGYGWVWKITKVEILSGGGVTDYEHVVLTCVLTGHEKGARINDDPQTYPLGGMFQRERDQNLNMGFAKTLPNLDGNRIELEYRVRTEQGEEAPTFACRLRLNMSFPEAALTLLLSAYGGQNNHGTYDLVIGGRGIGANPNWINIGSTPADVLDVDRGTQEWLELAALYDDPQEYAFPPGTKLGDWFRNELSLRNMILAFVPSTGKLCARTWMRPHTGSEVELNPIVYPSAVVPTDGTLEERHALFLERGIEPVTLAPLFRKQLQDPDARSGDISSATTLRIWSTAQGAFNDDEFTGALANLMIATLGVGLGTPRLLAIKVGMDAGLQFADLVTWTDSSIPTATGRGVSSIPLIVLGLDPNTDEEELTAFCLEDLINAEAEDTGLDDPQHVGVALVIKGLELGTNEARLLVASVDGNQDITSALHDSLISDDLVFGGGYLAVRTPYYHNPQGAGERPGYREVYVTVTNYIYDSARRQNWLYIAWGDEWFDDRSTPFDPESVIAIGSYVLLPDYRPLTASPVAIGITPLDAQSNPDRASILHISPTGTPRFDGRKSFIG